MIKMLKVIKVIKMLKALKVFNMLIITAAASTSHLGAFRS